MNQYSYRIIVDNVDDATSFSYPWPREAILAAYGLWETVKNKKDSKGNPIITKIEIYGTNNKTGESWLNGEIKPDGSYQSYYVRM